MNETSGPIIFQHIMGTGGTTLNSVLLTNLSRKTAITYPNHLIPRGRGVVGEAVSHPDLITGHLLAPTLDQHPGSKRLVTMLREPIAWMRSRYVKHLERGLIDCDFERFVLKYQELGITNYQSLFLASDARVVCDGPQKDIIASNARDAFQRLENFAFVGITEAMRLSVWMLCRELGWPPTQFISLNRAAKAPSNEELGPKAMARIRALLANDLRLFECHFQRLESARRAMSFSEQAAFADYETTNEWLQQHQIPARMLAFPLGEGISRLAVYGAGLLGQKIMAYLEGWKQFAGHDYRLCGFFDRDPAKSGSQWRGHPIRVVEADALAEMDVIVLATGENDRVIQDLTAMGIPRQRFFDPLS